MTPPRLCNARWELGSAGHVYIQWPEPLPEAELVSLEQFMEVWMLNLRRRNEAEEHGKVSDDGPWSFDSDGGQRSAGG